MTTDQRVYIAGEAYLGAVSAEADQESTVPTRRTEDQYEVADTIAIQAPSVTATLYLQETDGECPELRTLERIRDGRTLVGVTTRTHHYPDMAITRIRVVHENSRNVVPVQIAFRQVRKAVTRLVETGLALPAEKTEMAGSTTAQSPGTASVPAAPTRTEQSWLDSLNGALFTSKNLEAI